MQNKHLYGGPDDARLADLGEAQDGAVGRAQLFVLGYTRRQIDCRLKTGRLHRKYRGVYAVGHPKLSVRGQWFAAVLACGEGACLSHRDALAVHDLGRVPAGDPHVTAPRRRTIPGIRCHWARSLQLQDVTVVDGLSVTTIERTVLDLAAEMHPNRLSDLLERLQHRNVFDLNKLTAVITRNPGHHGAAPLRAALDELTDEPPITRTELERMLRRLIQDHDLPMPGFNVDVAGKCCDMVWADQRLIVETDGWETHQTRPAFEADRASDRRLATLGWLVVRVTYRQLKDEPQLVADQLRTLLAGTRAA